MKSTLTTINTILHLKKLQHVCVFFWQNFSFEEMLGLTSSFLPTCFFGGCSSLKQTKKYVNFLMHWINKFD